MKLPDDPKERSQLMVLMGIFGMDAVYGIYMAASSVVMKPQREKQEQIEEITEKLRKANDAIELMPMSQKNNDKHIAIISEIDSKYVLHPRMGKNYLLPAEEFVREQEAASDSKVISVKEIGISEFPTPEPPKATGDAHAPKPKPKVYAFKIYTVRVEVAEGLHNLIKLIKQIESAHPLVSISTINITPEEETPFIHNMSFDIQWPIWNATMTTEKIMGQLNSPTFRGTIKKTTAAKTEKTKPKTTKPANAVNTVNDAAAQAELQGLGIPTDEN
jgi:hypothetical protein